MLLLRRLGSMGPIDLDSEPRFSMLRRLRDLSSLNQLAENQRAAWSALHLKVESAVGRPKAEFRRGFCGAIRMNGDCLPSAISLGGPFFVTLGMSCSPSPTPCRNRTEDKVAAAARRCSLPGGTVDNSLLSRWLKPAFRRFLHRLMFGLQASRASAAEPVG